MYVEAKCPLCERKHRVEMEEWSGNGIPRKFCNKCKSMQIEYGYKVEIRTISKVLFKGSNDYIKPGIITEKFKKFKKGD